MSHGILSTTGTGVNTVMPDRLQDFRHRHTTEPGTEPLMPLQPKNKGQVFLFGTIVQKAVITNLLKTGRKHMHHKSADKFLTGDGYGFCPAGFVVLSGKSNGFIGNGLDPGVGNGDAVCISAKIFNGITKSVKGFFDIGTPVFSIKSIAETAPFIGVSKFHAGSGKQKFLFFKQPLQIEKKFPPEFTTKNFNRDKEIRTGCAQISGFVQPSPCHNTVDVGMKI